MKGRSVVSRRLEVGVRSRQCLPEGHAGPGVRSLCAPHAQCLPAARSGSRGVTVRDPCRVTPHAAACGRLGREELRPSRCPASLSRGSPRGRGGELLECPPPSRSNTCWCGSCCAGGSGGDSTSRVPSCWPWVTPEKNFRALRRRGLPVGAGEWGAGAGAWRASGLCGRPGTWDRVQPRVVFSGCEWGSLLETGSVRCSTQQLRCPSRAPCLSRVRGVHCACPVLSGMCVGCPVCALSRTGCVGCSVGALSCLECGGFPVCTLSCQECRGYPMGAPSYLECGGCTVRAPFYLECVGCFVRAPFRPEYVGCPVGALSRLGCGGCPVCAPSCPECGGVLWVPCPICSVWCTL